MASEKPTPIRRPYTGEERRRSPSYNQYNPGEMPPYPTPGDPGSEADRQHQIERRRTAEREADKTNKVKRTPQSN